ncbi:MAG: endonuclease III [Bacteroidota bacterium]
MNRSAKTATHIRTRKTRRVAAELEEFLGVPPKPRRSEPPLECLIATLLSQNTNDRNSHRAWMTLRKRFPTWQRVADAPTRLLAKAIEVGGLKNQKARRIKQILRGIKRRVGKYDLSDLKRKSEQEVLEYLTSMDGVGLKTAACVLVFSLGREVFPVDTHIHRICNRLGLVRTKNAEETFHAMQPIVPKRKSYSFHVNLIRFGRSVCKARNPLCGVCPLFDLCVYPAKERFAEETPRGARSKRTDADFMILHNLAVS